MNNQNIHLNKSFLALVGIFLMLFTPLYAETTSSPNSSTSPTPKIKVIVGTEGTMNPFTYFDENNRLTGFDIEVVRAIEKVDPNLSFTFVTSTWDSLFPGLDAGHYHMLANQIATNTERRERYQLSNESYFRGSTQAFTLKARTSELKELTDLTRKRIATGVGSNHSLVIEKWNKEHGNIIDIVYYDGEVGLMFQDLLNYRIDAIMNSPAVAAFQAKANGVDISFIGEPFYDAQIHLIFSKTSESEILKSRIDAALVKLREEGTLKELSVRFFGHDLT